MHIYKRPYDRPEAHVMPYIYKMDPNLLVSTHHRLMCPLNYAAIIVLIINVEAKFDNSAGLGRQRQY